ncbi:helix-turn-helix transcriptional regulator [Nocardia sp. NBC_01499]|uniref:helix-turn-helix transcriptional regulator n=1 Tax=Nocardia sp. NBC_01499 TaxID=2903597 RepID=UPI0038631988
MDRLTRDLRGLAAHAVGPDDLGAAIAETLRSCVAFDAVRLVSTNPAAELGLGSFSCWHRYDSGLLSALVLDRYLGGDPCRPEDLERLSVPVAVVGVDGDNGARGRRTARLLSENGASGELRALLRDRRGVWGFLGLLRTEGARPFDHEDVNRVAELGPAFNAAIREFARGRPSPIVPVPPAPGIITVGADHAVKGISDEAHYWLEQLWLPSRLAGWAMEPFAPELYCRTRELIRQGVAPKPLICAAATGSGRWIAVHGRALAGDDGDVAIVMQAARGDLLLPSFCHWYELTARQRAILEQLCTGDPPRTIAKTLAVSTHTVNAHLKAVYHKTGADGRDELMAALTC